MQPIIRRIKRSDASDMQSAVLESVGHISPWLDWCTPSYRLSDAVNWTEEAAIKWQDGSDYRFVIADAESNLILGSVAIRTVCARKGVGDLGYWLRKRALGRGYCTQAAELAIEFAFKKLGFKRIEMRILPENEPSNAVALRLGASFDGLQPNKITYKGEAKIANCYSHLPEAPHSEVYANQTQNPNQNQEAGQNVTQIASAF